MLEHHCDTNTNHTGNFGFHLASLQVNQKSLAALVNQNQTLLEGVNKLLANTSISLQPMNHSVVSLVSVGGHFFGNDSTIRHPICNEHSSNKE